jgi:hypothetical protein
MPCHQKLIFHVQFDTHEITDGIFTLHGAIVIFFTRDKIKLAYFAEIKAY